MLTKKYSKTGRICRVTFHIPQDLKAHHVNLCGEFNDWSTSANPMERHKDGSFTLTLKLKAGREYRYRYLVDDERWVNDYAADGYITNRYNGLDSIVRVENFAKHA